MSVGGVLGGLFNALVAPLLFTTVLEYPLALVLACALRPARFRRIGDTARAAARFRAPRHRRRVCARHDVSAQRVAVESAAYAASGLHRTDGAVLQLLGAPAAVCPDCRRAHARRRHVCGGAGACDASRPQLLWRAPGVRAARAESALSDPRRRRSRHSASRSGQAPGTVDLFSQNRPDRTDVHRVSRAAGQEQCWRHRPRHRHACGVQRGRPGVDVLRDRSGDCRSGERPAAVHLPVRQPGAHAHRARRRADRARRKNRRTLSTCSWSTRSAPTPFPSTC